MAWLLAASAVCLAQQDGWARVQALSEESRIQVRLMNGHHVRCSLVYADARTLHCERHFGLFGPGIPYNFDRAEIAEVRTTHHEGNRALTVLIIVAVLTGIGGVEGLLVAMPLALATYAADGSLPLIPSSVVYRVPLPGVAAP